MASTALKTYRGDRPLKEVADLLGVTPPTIYKWETGRVPAERCIEVSSKTGIPVHLLRPDVFPVPADEVAA